MALNIGRLIIAVVLGVLLSSATGCTPEEKPDTTSGGVTAGDHDADEHGDHDHDDGHEH